MIVNERFEVQIRGVPRFVVEDNPTDPVDIDFRMADVSFGSDQPTLSGPVAATFLSPPGSIYSPVVIKRPGEPRGGGRSAAFLTSKGALLSGAGGLTWAYFLGNETTDAAPKVGIGGGTSTVRLGHGTSRPSAIIAGKGAVFYDDNLSIPVYSDGTLWRDALGNVV